MSDWRIESLYGGRLQFFRQSDTSTTALTISASGGLGVGTTSPIGLLHLRTELPENVSILLDVNGTSSLTIQSILIGTQDIGWRFLTISNGIVKIPLEFSHNGSIKFQKDIWHSDTDGKQRFYLAGGLTTFIRGHGTVPISFRNEVDTEIMSIDSYGGIKATSYILANSRVYSRGSAFDTWLSSDGGMSLNMGLRSTKMARHILKWERILGILIMKTI